MLIAGTLTPAMAVSSKAYSFEDNLEVAIPDVAYEELYVPGEILVKFNPGVSEAKISDMNSKNGAAVTYTSPYAGFKILKIPKTKSVEEMVEIYSKNPNVEYASANYIAHAAMVPNDEYYYLQWNFNSTYGINVTEAWNISTGKDVIVAVLDTGVAQNAPDLANTNFTYGWDFVNGDDDPTDDNSHGTHVTGTIAQSTNNNIGVAGVAYNCTIMPVKILNKRGSGTLGQIVDGIYYATNNFADVISMSLGFTPGIDPDGVNGILDNALDNAHNNGVTIVAAAGNDETGIVSYPAADENCIAVGATGYNGDLAYYSNWGTAIDVMAPGGELYRTLDNQIVGYGILQNTFDRKPTAFDYYLYQGTSMATPHVSGVAALLIANGVTGPDNVRAAIENTAQDIYTASNVDGSQWDIYSGYGIVDAYAALNYANGGATPSPTNQAPTASMSISPTSANVGETITFDASGSTDGDGSIDSYSWIFGDGTESTESTAYHEYLLSGTYTVTLTVTDDGGAIDTAPSETVTITNPSTLGTIDVEVSVTTEEKNAGVNTFARGKAEIKVYDGDTLYSGSSVASVSGQWDGATSDADIVITESGIAIAYSDYAKYENNMPLTFIFTVNSVTIDGKPYFPESQPGTGYYP
ncbi:S8 family serine peptidase [Methanolobus mangrovi]|uniref:S8 family serine peptidase n=1 Tax=Methanolobus mangrovi TaxID=3072977 RepID=A0AA51YJ47_9EURY|nr:S8 family serine peptidase [Methanolobus mangrovi]WMW21769.1 S8 family serine peptidase [Methanolobus mangrovi]